MGQLPNLIWVRSFECAARHLSFTKAAKELGITQTALSLHVRSLEARLDCQLFTRSARSLALTEVGEAYAFSLRRALGDIALSTTSLFGSDSVQVLTVRAPISTAALWLAQRMPEFHQAHPKIKIKLISNIWADSVGPENVDVDILIGKGDWAGVAARKISSERIVPIAPSASSAGTALEFGEVPLVRILGHEDMFRRYTADQVLEISDDIPEYLVDTTLAAIEIVAAGGGQSVVLERFAHQAIKDGKSIQIVGEPMEIEQSHHLVGISAPDVNDSAKYLFESWLESAFCDDGSAHRI